MRFIISIILFENNKQDFCFKLINLVKIRLTKFFMFPGFFKKQATNKLISLGKQKLSVS